MTKYEETLNKLSALIRRKPMTAKEIAKAMKCCKPAVYQRLAALDQRLLCTRNGKSKQTGPAPLVYWIE